MSCCSLALFLSTFCTTRANLRIGSADFHNIDDFIASTSRLDCCRRWLRISISPLALSYWLFSFASSNSLIFSCCKDCAYSSDFDFSAAISASILWFNLPSAVCRFLIELSKLALLFAICCLSAVTATSSFSIDLFNR